MNWSNGLLWLCGSSTTQCYKHLSADIGPDGPEIIKATILKIIKTAKALGKIVVATGDVHYLNKEDQIYRNIFLRQGIPGGGVHPLMKAKELPEQHLLTTDEMLKAFEFLGKDLAYEIVVTNTNKLNDLIEPVKAFPDVLYSLNDDAFKDLLGVESINDEVVRIVNENMVSIYGEKTPQIVLDRVKKELSSIIDNHFAPIYYISYLLVKKSLEDGYLVGSRGSVGSSLVATLLNITEVNPLPPHYYCPNHDFQVFKLTQEQTSLYPQTKEQINFKEIVKKV